MMNKLLSFFGICLFIAATCWSVVAQDRSGGDSTKVDPFIGRWVNIDRNADYITRVEIHSKSGYIYTHMWHQCSPKDCDWDEVKIPISDAVNDTFSIMWDFGFELHAQSIKILSDGKLQVTTHVNWKGLNNSSGSYDRKDYFSLERSID